MFVSQMQTSCLQEITVDYLLSDLMTIYRRKSLTQMGSTVSDQMGGMIDPTTDSLDSEGYDLTLWAVVATNIPCMLQTLYPHGDAPVADQPQGTTIYTVSVPIGTDIGVKDQFVITTASGLVQMVEMNNYEDLQTDGTVMKFTALERR